MCGGDAAALESYRSIPANFAGLIPRLGDAGTGQLAKRVNNALMAANLALAHEALSLSDKIGIERAALTEVISASSGASFAHSFYASMPDLAFFTHAATLLPKDLRLLEDIATENALPIKHLHVSATDFFAAVAATDRHSIEPGTSLHKGLGASKIG
jgi:3-hydroxyisobutyrate dehydrogenase-like beta-hydroxyacid dehydrogenase